MSVEVPRVGQVSLRRRLVLAALVLLAAGLSLPVSATQPALAASMAAVSISAGYYQSCAIEGGKAYCWGSNDQGQLGDGSGTDSSIPVAVDTSGVLAGKTLTQITAGASYTCALDSIGAAYCWGWNVTGDLGDGSTSGSDVPVAVDTSGVLAGKKLTEISAGDGQTCALDSTGAAYCWGINDYGQLGNGTTSNSDVPVAVATSGVLAGKTLTQIAASGDNVCALDTSGLAYCWGQNQYGTLGDGTTTNSDVPVAVDTSGVLAGKTLTQIAASGEHSCALDTSGAAFCWGDGYLGDGSTAGSSVPVAVDTGGVLAGKALTQIAAGGNYTCALDSAGAAFCWGDNDNGQLGDGSTGSPVSMPVAVETSGVLAGKALTQISASWDHTCAVDASDATYCWGYNYYGELGDNNADAGSDVPVLAGPQAPADVTAMPGDSMATVSWSAPANLDGGALSGYTATASPGGEACSTSGASTCTISGLTNGTGYSITVVAYTTVGESGASAPTSVTPGSGIAFTSAPNDTVAFGAAFRYSVTASGSPAPTITKTGKLPSGVHFKTGNDGTATISGTPDGRAAGVYPLTFTAKNGSGTATQAFTLTVTRPPAIKKIPTTTARTGSALNLPIKATGYPAAALTESGPLPTGLTFADHGNGTAAITGTPATNSGGSYSITITAASTSGTASQRFTLKVDQPPAIARASTATAAIGSTFSLKVTATGFPAPKITSLDASPWA